MVAPGSLSLCLVACACSASTAGCYCYVGDLPALEALSSERQTHPPAQQAQGWLCMHVPRYIPSGAPPKLKPKGKAREAVHRCALTYTQSTGLKSTERKQRDGHIRSESQVLRQESCCCLSARGRGHDPPVSEDRANGDVYEGTNQSTKKHTAFYH